MVKLLMGTCIVVAASLAAWGIIMMTHPVFVATEAIEASKKAGVLTEEMSAEVDHEDFKSALVTFSIWGVIVGLAFGISSPLNKTKLPLRAITGAVLGTIGGLAAAYISNRYARFSEPPIDFSTYWLTRWIIVLLPLAAALGIAATVASWNAKMMVENIVRVGVGVVLAICVYVFSMGFATPIEQSQYLFPGFKSNSSILMVTTSLFAILILSLKTGKVAEAKKDETSDGALNNTP